MKLLPADCLVLKSVLNTGTNLVLYLHALFSASLHSSINDTKKKKKKSKLTLSGKLWKEVLPGTPFLVVLKRRMMSWSVAATTKYSCFRRSSFPSKNCKHVKTDFFFKKRKHFALCVEKMIL